MTSRLEISFQRLLSSTETLAVDQNNLKGLRFRRLETYVGELQNKLTELQKAKTCENDVIAGYSKRLSFLANLIDSESQSEVSRLSNGFDHSSPSVPSSIRQRIVHQKSISSANASPASSYVLKQSTPGSAKETEIKLKVTSRREKDVRKELFRMEDEENKLHDEQRKPGTLREEEDVEVIIKRHNEMQEQLAEDMIRIARNMKEHQLAAKKIITDDNEKLTESSNLADRNYDRLKTETERVQEHTRRSCSCWIWLMVIVVCIVFIWMILFIRIVPKR
ncbi:vesicle transport protein USE1-like [Corticium candelabrum]|uniref:vesicle transport protein USE1-like n=1 Tax=Corticium candelabrum TaxID=121492 RepID=UPI002E2669D4|nr:vesicle transport protein USE1-like [Corticium candelabrum]